MQIRRAHSRLSFRTRLRDSRRGGCFSFVLLVGVLIGVGVVTWNFIDRRLLINPAPTLLDDMLSAARAAYALGDLTRVIDLLQGQPQPAPLEAALLTRALIYRSYSDYNRAADRALALEITTELIERDPLSADAWAAHAFALQANALPGAAADAARSALETAPQHPLAITSLALAYGSAGNFETALRESQRAALIATTPEDTVDALRAVAISFSDQGSYADAVRIVESALEINDNLLVLYFERALYALQLGDTDRATVAYYDVLVRDAGNVKARLRLCEVSSLLRERESSIRYCGEVTQLAPSWAEGWFQLGREYFLRGDFAQAQTNFNRCSTLQTLQNIPIEQRRFECWYLQGQAAQILGDCQALVATYNEFRAMAASADIQQTWTYPPEGPPGC